MHLTLEGHLMEQVLILNLPNYGWAIAHLLPLAKYQRLQFTLSLFTNQIFLKMLIKKNQKMAAMPRLM